jgi:sensor histidine kinase regulating citrate/malate metabolism
MREKGISVTIRKLSKLLFAINVLLFLLGSGVLFGLWNHIFELSELVLALTWTLLLLSSLLSIGGLASVTSYQNRSYQESMQNLENLNQKLREQRHDYLNQMQIVYGLLELEEYEEAREYLTPVFKDVMKVGRALKTSKPAVNALLQAKMEAAERQGIDFYLEVTSQLSELSMEPWELCKILGNLIDNAITALTGMEGEKRITLAIRESKDAYYFHVEDNGPVIPKEHYSQIFTPGFTTKSEEGHGMGLAIVQKALRDAGGTMTFDSEEERTVFQFSLPKKNRKPLSKAARKLTK